MSGGRRAGNGRGNNRRRPFRWRDNENNKTSQKGDSFQKNGLSESGELNNIHNAGERKPQESAAESNQGRGSPIAHNQNRQNRGNQSKRTPENPRNSAPFVERQKWIPPVLNTNPLPVPDCAFCGKPIRDISSAIADRNTGSPVHFDCVTERIIGNEILEQGDIVTYIGGGRFGIVNFGPNNSMPADSQAAKSGAEKTEKADNTNFKIKKIIEWENNDKRAEWRSEISDHYSVT